MMKSLIPALTLQVVVLLTISKIHESHADCYKYNPNNNKIAQQDGDGSGSTLEEQVVKVLVKRTRSEDAPYQIQLTAFQRHFNLTLQRTRSSIFSPGFKFQGITLSKEDLALAEENIFVDPDHFTVLHVTQNEAGDYQLEGYMDEIGIHHGDGHHRAIRTVREPGIIPCGTPNTTSIPVQLPQRQNDRDPTFKKKRQGQGRQGPQPAIIEVNMVFDRTLAGQVTEKKIQLSSYAAVMLNAVNLIYASHRYRIIRLVLLNVFTLTPEQEATILTNTKYEVNKLTDRLGEDAGLQQDADIVVFLLGTSMKSYKQDGSVGNVVGRAGDIGGVCAYGKKVCCNNDIGGVWAGVSTVAHEAGHLLNAFHDFYHDETRPCHNTCYNMDYYGEGFPEIHFFSTCSQDLMERHFRTPRAACLFKQKSGNPNVPPKELPGDILGLNGQCEGIISSQSGGRCHAQLVKDERVTNCDKHMCPVKRTDECPADEDAAVPLLEILDGTKCRYRVFSGNMALGTVYGNCINGKCVQRQTQTQARRRPAIRRGKQERQERRLRDEM